MVMPPLGDLAVFMGLVLTLALYGLSASGHFPSEYRGAELRGSLGSLLLWGTMLAAVLVLLGTLAFALQRLPVSAAVIGGGAMLLAAPLLLQPFPDSFVNGRGSLIAFTVVGLGLSLIARQLAG